MQKLSFLSTALALSAGLAFTGCKPKPSADAITLPEAPDAAVRVIMDQIEAGNAAILWTAMPATYQSDLTSLVREAGTKIDAEMYDQTFGLFAKLANVLGKQKTFILASPMAQQANTAEAEANWDPMVGMIRSFATSQLATAEGLKSIDLQAFLATTGSEMLKLAKQISDNSSDGSMFDQLKNATITAEDVTDSSATLTLSRDDEEPDSTLFTKVEGRWIPADMAAEWNEKITDAREQLAALTPEEMAKNKPQVMGMITMVDGVLTQLEGASTQEEFNQALQGAMMPLMGLMMMSQSLGK